MLGICAQSRMGKDTVADYIQKVDAHYTKYAFGDQLKMLICEYYHLSLFELEEYKTKSENHPNMNMTMRQALQLIGETMRQVSANVWVDYAMKQINNPKSIFSDVRYDNEMDAILRKGGTLILLGRSKYLSQDNHPSETNLKNAIKWFLENTSESLVVVKHVAQIPVEYRKFSYFLRNDGTLDDLEKNIHIMFKQIIAN